jgi:hypothetical protein
VIWRLGGKKSSFRMSPQASPAWQHDLRIDPAGTVSFFDNGATPTVHRQSRVIVLRLDKRTMTASLVSSFVHPNPLVSPSQGNFQPLPDGSWFVGWGQEPYLSEYSANGALLFDAHMPKTYQSYTALKYPWSGAPASAPVAVVGRGAGATALMHASWNGSTDLARWLILGGSTPRALKPLGSWPRQGFQTAIRIDSPPRYLRANALDSSGRVLGSSVVLHR